MTVRPMLGSCQAIDAAQLRDTAAQRCRADLHDVPPAATSVCLFPTAILMYD